MNESVYIGLAMPVDETEPVHAECVGKTKQAAKDAVKDTLREEIPITIRNVNWDDEYTEYHGWKFRVKEKKLHTENDA